MKIHSNWMLSICAGSAMLFTACGGGSKTPSSAATSGGEPTIVITDAEEWATLVDNGKVTYDTACGSCHPGGDADLGPALKNKPITVASMTKQIREGSGRMRPIGPDQLPEEQMQGLMVYMSTLNAVGDVKGP